MTASVADLIPTQNEIDLQKSLKFPLGSGQFADLLRRRNHSALRQPHRHRRQRTYIVDGHHRWSAIVLINPNTQVAALDLGYVPNPQTALKQAQIGVAGAKGFAVAPGGGINLYTTDEQTFDVAVRGYIETGAKTDEVLDVFTTYLGLEGQTDDEKYTSIQNYLWANVLRMRTDNPYIPGATDRSVMPQTDPLPVVQGYWGQWCPGVIRSRPFPIWADGCRCLR